MSQSGTNRQRTRADLLRRLEVLKPRDGDVMLLKLPDEYFGEDGPNHVATEFATAVMKAARRPVFIVQKGREELLYGPPDLLGIVPKQPPQAASIPVARAKIHLPNGVKLEGI